MIMKKVPVVSFVLIALMLMAGCAGRDVTMPDELSRTTSSNSDVTEATDTSAASEMTLAASTSEATAVVLTPVPSPAASASLKDGEYLILPGESAYYNVFDSSGKVIRSFFCNDVWDEPSPVGVYDETMLAKFQYQINYETDEVILYDKNGIEVCDIKDPFPSEEYQEICVKVLNGETVIAYQVSLWNEDYTELRTSVYIYFVAPDGTINDVCKAVDLPGKPLGLIGRKYFMVSVINSSGAEPIDLYDFSGNLADHGIEVIHDYRNTLFTSEAAMSIYIGDYYIKGQQVIGPDLKPVEADTLDKNGQLICGVVYHVNGVDCIASTDYYDGLNYFENTDSPNARVAIGYKGDTVSLKTQDWEFSADLPGYRFVGLNENTIVFIEGGRLHFVSRSTGQETAVLDNDPYISIAGQYVIVYETGDTGFYILDKDGTRRYSSSAATAEITAGEYVILHRGPYIGIADLDGNWVQKALTWELTRDQEYEYMY